MAAETNNPIELCQYLVEAVKEAADEQKVFHQDPAVRMIAMHVAFACNGDLPFLQYYSDAYDFCYNTVERDAVGMPLSSPPPKPPTAFEQ